MRQNMNWKKPFLIGAVFAAVLFSFGCPTGTKPEDVVKEEPKLELKSLKVEGADVNLKNPEVEITTTKNKVDKVEAEFNINVDKSEVKIASHTLKDNQFVDVKLSVEAKKGKYQAFDFTVKVKKLKKAEPEPDPKLELASLRIHGKDAKSGSCEVENTVTTVVATDVTATFTYGKVKTPEEIPVTVANGTLNEGANIVKLHVPAVPGKYKEWSLDINVTRKAPELLPPVLKSVRVFDKFVIFEDNDPTKAGSVDVPNSKTTLTAGDIKAYFTWQGNTSAERIPVTVTGAPVALTTEYQDITFKVAESAGKYKAFEKTIKVKRIALELKKIKVHAANFNKLEIKDISNPAHEARSTYLPKVNVFFYSDVNAPQEDTELVDIITTEPELEKTNSAGGIIKTWKLTQAGENTLKVKVNGELKYTVKVTRTPIEIDSVSVGNKWNLREGQSYEVAQDSPELLVTPARGAVCKGVSVTVGGGAPQTLVYDNVTGGYYKNLEGLDGTEKEVVITVEDPDNAEFNGIFKFKLKTTFDPMTAPIDPAVAVNKIWFGADPMDTVNVNKFEAAKSSDHEYTVTVDKNWKSSSGPLIWMIVEGGDNAKTADISAEEGAVSVKADGAAIFKSVKKYFDIRADRNIYVFKLTNGDKEALYKVTVKFEFEHKYTITVTQPDPAQGEIKAWRAKGGAREDIDLAASSNVIQEAKDKTLYFELIAKDGYKPVKLTVDTTEVTGATNVKHQTAGAIAYAYKVADKAVTVTGELAAAEDPELELSGLTIHGQAVDLNQAELTVTVNGHESVTSSDITATYTTPGATASAITIQVANGDGLVIGTPKDITITFGAEPGKHKGKTITVKVTRAS